MVAQANAAAVHQQALVDVARGAAQPLAVAEGPGPFAELLEAALARVAAPQQEASEQIERFNRGDEDEVHRTMLALKRASIDLKLVLSFRDAALDAFQRCLRAGD